MDNNKFQTRHYDHKDMLLLVAGASASILLIIASLLTIQNNKLEGYIVQMKQSKAGNNSQTTQTPNSSSTLTTADTSDWETYKSEEWQYQIGYPSNWTIDTKPYGGQYLGGTSESEIDKYVLGLSADPPNGDWPILVSIVQTSKEQLLNNPNYSWNKSGGYIKSRQKTSINGLSAEMITWDNDITLIYFERENPLQTIIFSASPPNGKVAEQYTGIRGQILSTFRFLPDTSEWQTYVNTENRFEIKYPDSFNTAIPGSLGGPFKDALILLGSEDGKYPTENINLDAFVDISTSNDTENCLKFLVNDVERNTNESIQINNAEFQIGAFTGAALGTRYDSKMFRTIHNNVCYEVALTTRDAGDKSKQVDYDNFLKMKEQANVDMEQILSTFKFIDSENNDVKGVSTTNSASCLERYGDLMSEIKECEEMDELTCFYYKGIFDKCNKSCLEEASEEECLRICMPVCTS